MQMEVPLYGLLYPGTDVFPEGRSLFLNHNRPLVYNDLFDSGNLEQFF